MTDVLPWVKWRFDRWRNDEGLGMCGLAARGLWIEMLSIMHGCDPYGHLAIKGKSPSARQIASMAGMTCEDEVESLLSELEDNGVFSRDVNGVIYCRRMVRDNASRESGRATGYLGGNPALRKQVNQNHPEPDNATPYPPPLTTPVKTEREEIREEEGEEKEREKRSLRDPKKTNAPDPKGRPLPADWDPGREGADFARVLGLDPKSTFDQFRDYWTGVPAVKGRKTDWLATWRNWCRNEAKRRPNGHAKPPPPVDLEFPNWNRL